jgi:hypothetical protein
MSDLQTELANTICDYAFTRELGWSRTEVHVHEGGISVCGTCRLCEEGRVTARGVSPTGSTWSHGGPIQPDAGTMLRFPHGTSADMVLAEMRANCRHECPRGHVGGKLGRVRLNDCADLNSDDTTARVLAQAQPGEVIFDRQRYSDTVAMFWVGEPREGWTG